MNALSRGFVLSAILASVTACGAPVATQRPAMGPHHAGPNSWHLQENAKRQEFCAKAVLKIARGTPNLNDVDHLPEAKRLYWLCLQQVGAAS